MTTSDFSDDRIRFLRRLRAVRQFRPDPVPDTVLRDLLSVGRWSGSASNRQTWQFVVVRDRLTLQNLAAIPGAAAGHLATAPLGVAIVLPGERPELETFDEGRVSERLMLAGWAHGIGSCIGWFTGPNGSWEASAEAKRLLAIPPERVLRTVLSFGYADEAARAARPRNPQPRKPIGDIAFLDQYGEALDPSLG